MANRRPLVVQAGVYPHQVERTIEFQRQALDRYGADFRGYAERPIPEDRLIEIGKDADVLLVSGVRVTPRVLDALHRCVAIVLCSVGFDNVSVDECTKRGIILANMPDVCTDEVADHTMALLLSCARKIPRLQQRLQSGIWDRTLLEPMPRLKGKTLGLVGFGRIGQEVAKRAAGFGMRIIAVDPLVSPDVARGSGVELVDAATLFREADFVSCHAPLSASTRRLLGAEAFAAMKRSAFLLNTARGGLVDEVALLAALQNGEIAGAGLDVFDPEPPDPSNPLLHMDNVVVTAHAAGYSDEVVQYMRELAIQETISILDGGTPRPIAFRNPDVRRRLVLSQ